MPPAMSISPVSSIRRRPYTSETGPTRGAVIPQVMAVAAASCPARATEVWNSCASATRSGPSITTESAVGNVAAESTMSSQVGEA